MARLAAIANALYYPTPDRVFENLTGALNLSGSGRLLDVCCGEGTAAAFLASSWGLKSYGVELHKGRYETALETMDGVLQGSYHQLKTDKEGFNVLFLNPPYDEGKDENNRHTRQEVQFLRDTTPYLAPNGILIYIIPRSILDNYEFQSIIRTQYNRIEVFQFPDPEYTAFKQVVVIARRVSQTYHYGYYVSGHDLPIMDENAVYNNGEEIALPALKDLKHFDLAGENPYEICPSFENKEGCYGTPQWDILTGTNDLSVFQQPLLEPRPGHQAMLLASGCLNGTEIAGDKLIRGSSEKVVKTIQDPEAEKEILRERIVSNLSVLDLKTGEVETWCTDKDPDKTKAWFDLHGDTLAAAIKRDHKPLFTPDMVDQYDFSGVQAPGILPGLTEATILPKQKEAAAAIAFKWRSYKSAILSGEMGVGKTAVGIIASALSNQIKMVVVCPGHLVEKWHRECGIVTKTRGCALIGKSLSDVDEFFSNAQLRFLILSKERAKLGARWRGSVHERKVYMSIEKHRKVPVRNVYGYEYFDWETYTEKVLHSVCVCPRCGETQTTKDGKILTREEFDENKLSCVKCEEPLWVSTPLSDKGTKRWALARYINRKYPGRYSLIIDEAHHTAQPDTDQSRAAQHLATSAKKILAMTGTLYGGRASSIFHILYKVDPNFRQLYNYDECSTFVAHHGLLEETRDVSTSTSAYGVKRGGAGSKVKEIPGINPAMINLLLGYTVFLRLEDLGYELPPFTEEVVLMDHDGQVTAEIKAMADEVIRIIREYPNVLGQYLMACLGYPDRPDQEENIVHVEWGGGKTVLAHARSIPVACPKDMHLMSLCLREKTEGRKVLVYCTQTHRRSPVERLKASLESAGLKVAVLEASVQPIKREAWLQKTAKDNPDVLITNGRLVETGLDLIEYPTIVQYGIEYSTASLRQSTRRSWRLGQTKPVKVFYYAYKNTMQEVAMNLISRKMRASEMLDGEKAGGLGQHDESGADFFLELAREVVLRAQK